jgi:hypothetical protein
MVKAEVEKSKEISTAKGSQPNSKVLTDTPRKKRMA